jgi:hypothetical protein
MTPFKQMRSARDLALEVEEVIEINQLGFTDAARIGVTQAVRSRL